MSTLWIKHPERVWLAARKDLAWLTDPDLEDGKQRHPDRDNLDWTAIARVVTDAGQEITGGHLQIDEDGDYVLDVPDEHLTTEERKIAHSWLGGAGLAPMADPWSTGMGDGRHRLWNAWRALPYVHLPVLSDVLGYLDELPFLSGPQLADIRADTQQKAAAGLATPSEVLDRAPSYRDELTRVAAGRF